MRYSLIVPAWNEAAFLSDTLQQVNAAIEQLHGSTEHIGELIVVDNNSTDNTAAIAREYGATVVFEPVNQIARARNRGATVASGQALIFIDADTVCSYQLLTSVLDHLASDLVVGGGSLITPDREVAPAGMRAIAGWNWISMRAKLAAGCFIYCRSDAFHAVGGFNERVYAGEELFLSRALKRWGRQHNMHFDIAWTDPVVTSARKLDWYNWPQLASQVLLILIPGAVFSKRMCKTWYDDGERIKQVNRSGNIK